MIFTQQGVPEKLHRARTSVLISVFLFWFAHYVFMPTLPEYVQGKTSTLAQVGFVLSMFGLWQVLVRLPVGIVTDHLGRRKEFILLGTLLAGAGILVLALAKDFSMLVVGRSLLGISMGAWVLQVVFFGSLFDNEEVIKAGAVLTLSSSLAKLAGTMSTGYLNSWGGYFFTFMVAIVAAVLSLFFFSRVPERTFPSFAEKASGDSSSSGTPEGTASGETAPGAKPFVETPPRFLRVLGNRKVLLVSALSGINQFLNFGVVFGFFPIKAGMMGASDVMKSYLLSVNILFLIGGNLLSTYLGKKQNSLRLLVLSYLFYSLGIVMIPVVNRVWWMFLFQAMLGAAHGISYPVLIGICIEDIPENGRATAMGLHQSLYAIGMFLGPWIAGVFADRIGLDSTFFLMGGGAFLVSSTVIMILRKSLHSPR